MGSYCLCEGLRNYIKINNNPKHDGSDELVSFGKKKNEPSIKAFCDGKTCGNNALIEFDRNQNDENSISSRDSEDNIIENRVIKQESKISEKMIEALFSYFPPMEENNSELIILYFHEGEEYRGECNPKTHEREGRGIQIWNNNNIYLGYWFKDKINGIGRKIYHTKNINDTNLLSDEINESYYMGAWKDGKEEGKGIEKRPDGTLYDGCYFRGMKWGHGKLKLSDGSLYEGDFKKDTINGYGKMIFANVGEYEGHWVNNKMHGEGTFIWNDHKKYIGHYSNGLKDGSGELIWPDGKIYKGSWSKGKQNGHGLIYDPIKGQWISGLWKEGKKIQYDNCY